MRYRTTIKVPYVAGGQAPTASAIESLRAAMAAELGAPGSTLLLAELVLSLHERNVVVVAATLQGATVRDLTSPVDALVTVDASFNRSLFRTGQFEEFDVARRVLRVAPAAA